MINTFACKIASFFVKKSRIDSKEKEVFVYGLEILLSSAASVFTALFISIPFRQFAGTFLYMVVFITLRQFTGGFHASSYRRCYFVFVCVYLSSLALVVLLPAEMLKIVTIIFLWVSLVPVFLFAPVPNANQVISENKRKTFRMVSRIYTLTLTFMLTALAFLFPLFGRQLLWGALASLTTAVFIVVAIIKNGGRKNEKIRV